MGWSLTDPERLVDPAVPVALPMRLADYLFVALGFASIGGIVWMLYVGALTIRSIRPYQGTWQDDLFDEGRGEWR